MPDQPSLRQARLALSMVVLLGAGAWAVDFELPPPEPASASLSPELASGPNFHVSEPVESDGLMHHGFLQRRTSNARLGY